MENVSVELYIISYTMLWIVMVFLYSLPLTILGKTYEGVKKIFNNDKWGWLF